MPAFRKILKLNFERLNVACTFSQPYNLQRQSRLRAGEEEEELSLYTKLCGVRSLICISSCIRGRSWIKFCTCPEKIPSDPQNISVSLFQKGPKSVALAWPCT